MDSTLTRYGWSSFLSSQPTHPVSSDRFPARIVLGGRGLFRIQTEEGAIDAVLSGRLRHLADGAEDLPVVGDWVACHRPDAQGMALIDSVLPRRTKLSRKVAGSRAVEQILAANIDTILLVMGLDDDYNPRRLERYLVMAGESGARPIVVLSKADLATDAERQRCACEAVAGTVPVLVIAALAGDLGELRDRLVPGETVVLVGSSGAGKSTLINRLAGEELLRTGAVRESDGRGQHTTTHRELVLLPDGCLLIDNPGLRELQLWSAEEGFDDTFEDVHQLGARCRFRDCTHTGEPDCAVVGAIADGGLEAARLASFHALQREARALAARRDARAARVADKRLGKLYKRIQREARERKG